MTPAVSDRSNAPQGVLQCWVDIMPPGDAKGFPLADVALPPDMEFEVRGLRRFLQAAPVLCCR